MKNDNNTDSAAIVAAITAALESRPHVPGMDSLVNLRKIHTALRCEEPFPEWALNNVQGLDAVEGSDFIRDGENDAEFFVSPDLASEIAIMDTTAAGKAWRGHLIDAEKRVLVESERHAEPIPADKVDRFRRLVGPENVTCLEGEWFFNRTGLKILCRAILEGREPGNPDTAQMMLKVL